jgi:hypothetical protein
MSNSAQKKKIIDLYKILGLRIEDSKKDNFDRILRDAYKEKLRKYYPKYNSNSEQNAIDKDMYLIAKESYNLLKNKTEREEYNKLLLPDKPQLQDFFSMKEDYNNYIDTVPTPVPNQSQQQQQQQQPTNLYQNKEKKFKKKLKKINLEKNNTHYDEQPKITELNVQDMLENIKNKRLEEENMFKQNKLLKNSDISGKKFNAIFDKIHENKIKKMSLVEVNDANPEAWEPLSSNFSNFDQDNEISDGTMGFNMQYSAIDLDDDDDIDINAFGDIADISDLNCNYDSHNKKDNDYYKNVALKLNTIKNDTSRFKKYSEHDFRKETYGTKIISD